MESLSSDSSDSKGMNVILFEEDWGRYPSATVHLETQNKSWLELSKKLELSGVKNNKFMLALINPLLRFVDPWREDLDKETQVMISAEIKLNPWYFFREIARFDERDYASGRRYFKANRGNIAALWNFFNHQDYNLTQPRQTGKSTSSNWLLVWLLFFVYRTTNIFLLTKDNTLRQNNVRQIKAYRDLLPNYLNMSSKADVNNLIGVSCVAYGNRLYTAVSQNAKADADKIGRGFACKAYVTDEGPYIKHLKTTLSSMLPGGDSAQQIAAENNEPYGNIYTTTAGSKSDESGKYYYDMVTDCLQWTDSLYDLQNNDAFKNIVDKACTDKRLVNITLNHRQLGFTDQWLIDILKKNGAKGTEANKDYFNIWDDGAAESPLDKELARLINGSKKEPKYIEYTKEGYAINWYISKEGIENRMQGSTFVAGLDTSDGVGRDAIAFTIVDVTTLEVVASMLVKETNLITFGNWLVDIMVKYKRLVLIPERKNQAPTLIDLLLIRLPISGEDPFKRIFNRVVHEDKFKDNLYRPFYNSLKRDIDAYSDVKDQFGYATAGSGEYSRNALYHQTLILACEYSATVINDAGTIGEILGLQRKNGRIDHSSNAHDDRVISWLLCSWLLIHGKNLGYYGITNPLSRTIDYKSRSLYGEDTASLDLKIKENEKQAAYKKEIEFYLDLLRNVKNDYLSYQYEGKLRKLESKYNGTDFGAMTVSDLINQTKSEKFKKRFDKKLFNKEVKMY